MLLFSVPGSGSCFALNFMTKHGARFSELRNQESQRTELVQVHADPKRIQEFEDNVWPLDIAFDKAIVPLRHPYKVYRSCIRMNFSHEAILAQWKCLVKKAKLFDKVFFSQVDIAHDRRQAHIEALAKFVGIDDKAWIDLYARAWKPINVWPEKYKRTSHVPDFDFAVDWYHKVSQE